jgi:hypothetical protein
LQSHSDQTIHALYCVEVLNPATTVEVQNPTT